VPHPRWLKGHGRSLDRDDGSSRSSATFRYTTIFSPSEKFKTVSLKAQAVFCPSSISMYQRVNRYDVFTTGKALNPIRVAGVVLGILVSCLLIGYSCLFGQVHTPNLGSQAQVRTARIQNAPFIIASPSLGSVPFLFKQRQRNVAVLSSPKYDPMTGLRKDLRAGDEPGTSPQRNLKEDTQGVDLDPFPE